MPSAPPGCLHPTASSEVAHTFPAKGNATATQQDGASCSMTDEAVCRRLLHRPGRKLARWYTELMDSSRTTGLSPQFGRGKGAGGAKASRRERAGRRGSRCSGTVAATMPAREDHPYLAAKGVLPNGIRQDGDCIDHSDAVYRCGLYSLQFIARDGRKTFLAGGRVIGCHFYIGSPKDVICIVEGFATGASVYRLQVTPWPARSVRTTCVKWQRPSVPNTRH